MDCETSYEVLRRPDGTELPKKTRPPKYQHTQDERQNMTVCAQRDINEINYVLGMYPYNKLREKYGRYGKLQLGVKRNRD